MVDFKFKAIELEKKTSQKANNINIEFSTGVTNNVNYKRKLSFKNNLCTNINIFLIYRNTLFMCI